MDGNAGCYNHAYFGHLGGFLHPWLSVYKTQTGHDPNTNFLSMNKSLPCLLITKKVALLYEFFPGLLLLPFSLIKR